MSRWMRLLESGKEQRDVAWFSANKPLSALFTRLGNAASMRVYFALCLLTRPSVQFTIHVRFSFIKHLCVSNFALFSLCKRFSSSLFSSNFTGVTGIVPQIHLSQHIRVEDREGKTIRIDQSRAFSPSYHMCIARVKIFAQSMAAGSKVGGT